MIESEYAAGADGLVRRVVTTQMPAMRKAAELVAGSIAAGGVLQAFGTGHSRIVTLELAARAGGLAPVSMLAVKDLVMFGAEDPPPSSTRCTNAKQDLPTGSTHWPNPNPPTPSSSSRTPDSTPPSWRWQNWSVPGATV